MKQLSKNNSTFFFLVLTAVLIVIAFVTHNRIIQYNASVEELMRINKLKYTIGQVLSKLKDAEIEQRGFLLTGDSAYLESFSLEKIEKNPMFDTIEYLIQNSPDQKKNFVLLKKKVHQRYEILLSNAVLLQKQQNPIVDEALSEGKEVMNEVRDIVGLMIQTENHHTTERTHYKDRTASLTPLFLLSMSLTSVIFISFFFFRLQKETAERITIAESNRLLKDANEKIENSERRFRTLSETIPHMLWTATPDGKKNFFNKYFFDYTGFGFDQLSGDGWYRIIFPADIERERLQWNENLLSGEDFSIEKRIRHHSGEYRWHITRGIAQKNSEGTIIGWVGTSTEIDDQKRVTEVLAKAEEQFRTFANSIQNLAWIANVDGWIYWYNQRWYDYTGTTFDDIQGQGWSKVHHPDFIDNVMEITQKAWKVNKPFEMTFPLRRHDGEYRWFLTRVYPVNDAEGNIERWIGTNTDITDQKAFTEELELKVKERTEQLEIQNQTFEIAENIANLGSYKWDLQQNVLSYSNNLFRLFDCEPNEFEPTLEKFLSFVHPEDVDMVRGNQQQTIEDKYLYETPYRIISNKGVVKHFRSSGNFSCEDNNSIMIGTVQDVTKDVEASKALKNKNQELENANAELASFNYVASHDLQEPLRKIQSFSKRIVKEESESLSEKAKDYLQRIDGAARRMQNLITSILSYARTTTADLVFEKTDLNAVFNEVIMTLQESMIAKNAQVDVPELPTINAIPVQMHQLFLNLMSNSLKYAKKDVAPYIKITAEKVTLDEIDGKKIENSKFWQFSITDNGIGFDQQYETRLFEVFQRLHGKNQYEGTGIGLAICKKIIQVHKGSISATGKTGVGATFTFLLPVKI